MTLAHAAQLPIWIVIIVHKLFAILRGAQTKPNEDAAHFPSYASANGSNNNFRVRSVNLKKFLRCFTLKPIFFNSSVRTRKQLSQSPNAFACLVSIFNVSRKVTTRASTAAASDANVRVELCAKVVAIRRNIVSVVTQWRRALRRAPASSSRGIARLPAFQRRRRVPSTNEHSAWLTSMKCIFVLYNCEDARRTARHF